MEMASPGRGRFHRSNGGQIVDTILPEIPNPDPSPETNGESILPTPIAADTLLRSSNGARLYSMNMVPIPRF